MSPVFMDGCMIGVSPYCEQQKRYVSTMKTGGAHDLQLV